MKNFEEEKIHFSIVRKIFDDMGLKTNIFPPQDYLSYREIERFLEIFFLDSKRELFKKFVESHIDFETGFDVKKYHLIERADFNIQYYEQMGDEKKCNSWKYLKKLIN